jgi:hypothetical protein
MFIFFCISNISKLKMHGLKSNLIHSPTVYKKEITQAGYQATQHPTQCTTTIKMKRSRERLRSEIQPKEGFVSSHKHLTGTTET